MSEAAPDRKRPPPVKVLSGQLRRAEAQRAADGGDVYVVKPARGVAVPLSLVWMQGTVLEAQLDRDTVLLMDETGTFAVQGVNNIPKGKPCLSQGKSPRLCRFMMWGKVTKEFRHVGVSDGKLF